MKFNILLPNGSEQQTNSIETVIATLKSYGVRGLNKKKPPVKLKEVGKVSFIGCLGRDIKVSITN